MPARDQLLDAIRALIAGAAKPLKAKEIAASIRTQFHWYVDRSEVNSVLHANKAIFEQDGEYRWTKRARDIADKKPDGSEPTPPYANETTPPFENAYASQQSEQQTDAPRCPACGRAMVRRTARKGPRRGHQFWGCSGYPTCKQTRDGSEGQANSASAPQPGVSATTRETSTPQADVAVATCEASEWVSHSEPRSLPILGHNRASVVTVFDSRGWLLGDAHKDVRNWAFEHGPVSPVQLSRTQRAFLSTLEKHLHRGKHVLLDPELEEYIKDHRAVLQSHCIGIGLDSLSVDAFAFDSDPEREFWSILTNNVSHLPVFACPQFPLEGLSRAYLKTKQRVDFLLVTAGETVIVEIDGAQHESPSQAAQDRQRDQSLTALGCRVQRVPVSDIQKAAFEFSVNRFDSDDATNTPEHIAHSVAVALVLALRNGVLRFGDGVWEIGFLGATDDVLRPFLIRCVAGAVSHLTNLGKLYGVAGELPKAIEVHIGDAVFRQGADGTVEGRRSHLHVHFSPPPCVEIPANHFFYRELPTSFTIKRDPLDVAPMNLVPDEDATRYFLRYFFRYPTFREGQWEGLKRALEGKDALVLMPTGHGKSLMYQLAAFLRPGCGIVIDPIISLMEDQLYNLNLWGISRCESLSSVQDAESKKVLQEGFAENQFALLFVSPERLQSEGFRASLRSLTAYTPISVVAIDEAHCVSEWGHDFRTAYLNVARNCREFCACQGSIPPIMGLTGTASRSVLKDVKRELEVRDFEAVITPSSFDRPELGFEVVHCHSTEKMDRLLGIMRSLPSKLGMPTGDFLAPRGRATCSGIVFCPHVNGQYGVTEVAHKLEMQMGTIVLRYSGTNPKAIDAAHWKQMRRESALRFRENSVPLMVATKAFGMGIDKPNIRYTVHYGIPPSIESFYQEAGRAGRDRSKAVCCIIASDDYPTRNRRWLEESTAVTSVNDLVANTPYTEGDDIHRVLFFHKESFKGIKFEMEYIADVLHQIASVDDNCTRDIRTASKGMDGEKQDRMKMYERALHRLVVLSFLGDYTVDYSHKGFRVMVNGVDRKCVRSSLFAYVANYQRSRAVELIKKLPDDSTPSREYLNAACRLLLEFIYDTVELGRRRALLEMMETARKGATDETIRKRILSYLQRSEFDERLDEIVRDDIAGAGQKVAELIEDIVSPNHAMALRGQTARYLESYPDYPPLLFLRGLVESMCADADLGIVCGSLGGWITSGISKYNLPREQLVKEYLYAQAVLSRRMKDALARVSSAVVLRCKDREFLRWLLQNARKPFDVHNASAAIMDLAVLPVEQVAKVLKEKAR